MNKADKKGTSLLEIVIVMAVVAIMGVMVTSFSLAVNTWNNLGTSRYNLSESENAVCEVISSFAENYDIPQIRFSAMGNKLYATETDGEKREFCVEFTPAADTDNEESSGVISAQMFDFELEKRIEAGIIELPEENPEDTENELQNPKVSEYALKHIEKITFNVESKDDKQIIICRMFYYLPKIGNRRLPEEGTFLFVYTTKADR